MTREYWLLLITKLPDSFRHYKAGAAERNRSLVACPGTWLGVSIHCPLLLGATIRKPRPY